MDIVLLSWYTVSLPPCVFNTTCGQCEVLAHLYAPRSLQTHSGWIHSSLVWAEIPTPTHERCQRLLTSFTSNCRPWETIIFGLMRLSSFWPLVGFLSVRAESWLWHKNKSLAFKSYDCATEAHVSRSIARWCHCPVMCAVGDGPPFDERQGS